MRSTEVRRSSGLTARKIVVIVLAATALQGASPETPAAIGRKVLDLLLAGRYEEFTRVLTPEASQLLTPAFLRDRIGGELKGFGKVLEIQQAVSEHTGGADLVVIPVRFTNTTVNVEFTLNAAGKIAGLHFRPPDQALPTTWSRPAYSKPDQFRERPVTVGADEWKLGGTFTYPTGRRPFPSVVLVHGPGPDDRDESLFGTRMFADIAEGLASRGIAVLRYDKRTKVYSEKMSALPFTLQQETIEDAVRALAVARSQPEADPRRVFVLGHSLGGYATPRIAKQDGKLAGAIVLAGNARHIEDVSLAQTDFMLKAKGGASPDEQKRLELMKAEAAKIRSLTPAQDNPPILLGLPVEYYLNLKSYDAPAEAKRVNIPFLFLQGQRDFQVTMDDFSLWKVGFNGSKNATFQTYVTLNHLFIAGEGAPSPTEYRKPGNVAAAVIDDIADWILKRR